MYTVYFDSEIYQTYPFPTHFKGGFMPYDEAKTYLKLIQILSITSVILSLITMAVPDIAFLSITVGFATLTFTAPIMDSGHLITKGECYTVEGGTWPIALCILNTILLAAVTAATEATQGNFLTNYYAIAFIFSIALGCAFIIYFNKHFTPIWEEYRK